MPCDKNRVSGKEFGHGFSQIHADKKTKNESFERLILFVISSGARNLK